MVPRTQAHKSYGGAVVDSLFQLRQHEMVPSKRWGSNGTTHRLRAFVLVVLAVGLSSPPALAYIDPGTGSALVYVITALVLSIYFALRGFYYKVLELIFGFRVKKQKCNVALHSEDPRYEVVFLPLIRALTERRIDFTYLTMYERTGSFEPLPNGTVHHAIPHGLVGYSFLNHLTAKVVVTTTPQLDVMTFRRSEKVQHYCHIPHALGESRYVRPYAYDFFDSVFCCGEILRNNIRRMEQIRGLPAKQLHATGIPHYDALLAAAQHTRTTTNARPLVLLAPSWGPLSIFQRFGTDLVKRLATHYEVLVRPHPQMKISQPELYAEVLQLEGVEIDTQQSPADAMRRADILVSDISGIMHEFAFIHEKPVIIIDHKQGVEGLEGFLLGGDSELKERCRDFIIPVPPEETDSIVSRVDSALKGHSKTRLQAVRGDLIYNFGRASPAAATQIEEILRCL